MAGQVAEAAKSQPTTMTSGSWRNFRTKSTPAMTRPTPRSRSRGVSPRRSSSLLCGLTTRRSPSSMIKREGKNFKTDDMALATVLSMMKDVPLTLEMSGKRALWVTAVTPEVEEKIEEFKYDATRVEQRQFM